MAKIERATKGSIGREYRCAECERQIKPGEEYCYWQPEGPNHLRCMDHAPNELEAELIMAGEAATAGFRASAIRHIDKALDVSQSQGLSEMRQALLEARDALEEGKAKDALPHLEEASRASKGTVMA